MWSAAARASRAEELAGLMALVPDEARMGRPAAAEELRETAEARLVAEARADAAEARVAALEVSTSWRVTAPLPRLARAIRPSPSRPP